MKTFLIKHKINISLLSISILIFTILFEIFLEIKMLQYPLKMRVANKNGIDYDRRLPFEILKELNLSGFEVFPNLRGSIIPPEGISTEKGYIFPLGGISNTNIILSNENGYYPIVETDKFGFSNPKELFDNDIDTILLGDSFAEGYSVKPKFSIASLMRKNKINTISLGKAGSGPLLQFATLIEYIKYLKPKRVVWLYYENDLHDLDIESNSEFLIQYINNKNFSQNLINRQEEIDESLKQLLRKRTDNEYIENSHTQHPALRISKLLNIRILVTSFIQKQIGNKIKLEEESIKIDEFDYLNYYNIIKKASNIIKSWGGELFILYLPSYINYYNNKETKLTNDQIILEKKNSSLSQKLLLDKINDNKNELHSLDIKFINIKKLVFDKHEDPLSLFPLRLFGHYNEEGYKLISEEIIKEFK